MPEALGDLDELNSWLGQIAGIYPPEADDMRRIQRQLMNLSSRLNGSEIEANTPVDTAWLEEKIDRMSDNLPVLRGFILPKGEIHIARTVCRRAERSVVRLVDASGRNREPGDWECLAFINRLSDFLFTLARSKTQPDIPLRDRPL